MPKRLWPIETDPDDPSVPHVTVPCAGCPAHFFVAKDHPSLPDGPFFCAAHQDAPPTNLKTLDHTEADLICDCCGTKLTVQGPTHEEALASLWALVTEQRWESAFDGAPADLCPACKST